MRLNSTDQVPQGAIAVGVDGSDYAAIAVGWAANQAALEHRPLVLVHSASLPSPHWLGHWGLPTREFEVAVREEAEALLADAVDRAAGAAGGLEVSELLLVEDPRSVLLRLSEAARMIVVGSRGRGPVRSLLLGSVGAALVRHADCPVIVVRPGDTEPDLGVVVGVDARAGTASTLEFAYQQAAARHVSLTVAHVARNTPVSLPAAYVDLEPTEAEMDEHRRMTAELISGMAERHPDVEVRTEVGHGQPQRVLTTLGNRSELLVVGAHESGRLTPGLTASVVEHARRPVAVVPSPST